MRKSLIAIFALSTISIYIQFRTIKPDLFLEEIYAHLPFLLLVSFSIWAVYRDTNRYYTTRERISFLPTTLGFIAILIVISNMNYRSDEGYGKTIFKAYNHNIDHGVILDFKSNNNLKITQLYRMGTTKYWGSFMRVRDTFSLSENLDLKWGSKAVLKNDTLTFFTSGQQFKVEWPPKNEREVIITPAD